MLKFTAEIQARDLQELVDRLRDVADKVAAGCTASHGPRWPNEGRAEFSIDYGGGHDPAQSV